MPGGANKLSATHSVLRVSNTSAPGIAGGPNASPWIGASHSVPRGARNSNNGAGNKSCISPSFDSYP